MGYQFSALLFQGGVENVQGMFTELGFPNAVSMGHSVFVDAINPTTGTRHAAESRGWTMLTDAGAFVSMNSTSPGRALWSPQVTKLLKERSKDSRAFAFTMSSVSGSNGFTLFENGKAARTLFRTFDDVLNVDEGEVLSEETEAFQNEDIQASILRLMELLNIPFRQFETATFASFAFETGR